MYSNTLGYNKCQTYIEVSYLFYNYYIFYLWKVFVNCLSEKEVKCSVFLSWDILFSSPAWRSETKFTIRCDPKNSGVKEKCVVYTAIPLF